MPQIRYSPLKPLLLRLLLQKRVWHLLHCPCLLLCAGPAAVVAEAAPEGHQALTSYGYLQAPEGKPLHQLQLLQRAERSVGSGYRTAHSTAQARRAVLTTFTPENQRV